MSADNKESYYQHSAEKLLEKFFATERESNPDHNKPWSTADGSAVRKHLEGLESGYAIDFLVATFPKPSSPALSYQFDAYLEAMNLAVGQEQYVMNSFDLPWLDEAKNHSPEFRLGQEIDLSLGSGDSLAFKAKDEDRFDDPGTFSFPTRSTAVNNCY
ncbi:MAG: hypothetical protein ACLQU2_04575 [Candidatus Binataceae bacterium]